MKDEHLKNNKALWIKKRMNSGVKKKVIIKPEDIIIEDVTYSSGESGEDENRLGRQFLKMKEKQKDLHMRRLWHRLLAKLKGAVIVLETFRTLQKRIYLFGTSTKLKFEIATEKQIGWYIIMPNSTFRNVWNLVVLMLLVYTATLVPYRTAFIEAEDERNIILPTFDVIVDIMYMFDLILNFFMAYENSDKKTETRLNWIACHYLQSWFTLDFLACIPF